MILPKEISKNSTLHRVRDQQIEKDYILTWMLSGIANHAVLSQALVFKGGTVLKKCYFVDYRFSEDLDFTLLDETLTHEKLRLLLEEVFDWVKEETNITFQHKDDHIHTASGSSLFYVDYIGPLGGNIGSRDIKIDITRGEKLEFAPDVKTIFNIYSDQPKDSYGLLCYSLSEVLVEKMAALMGRTEARDLYDYWYLMNVERLSLKDHYIEFENKAKHKGHDPKNFETKVLSKEKIFKRDWEEKLKHQIQDLPEFDGLMRETKRYLK